MSRGDGGVERVMLEERGVEQPELFKEAIGGGQRDEKVKLGWTFF